MIRPLIILDTVLKEDVVIGSWTHIDDEVVGLMSLFEVAGNILDGISVCFFDKVWGRESHGDDTISNVGEIKLLSLVAGGVLGPSHNLLHNAEHAL